jgi:hypothetical protein
LEGILISHILRNDHRILKEIGKQQIRSLSAYFHRTTSPPPLESDDISRIFLAYRASVPQHTTTHFRCDAFQGTSVDFSDRKQPPSIEHLCLRAPPLEKYHSDSEMKWLLPFSEESVRLVDDSEFQNKNVALSFSHLILQSSQHSLTPTDLRVLTHLVESYPFLVPHSPLAPSLLPLIVRHNPSIATLCLSSPSLPLSIRDKYISCFLEMDINTNSLEIIHNLSTKIPLPAQFLSHYLIKCFSRCSQMEEFLRKRFVRLLCLFMLRKIQNRKDEIWSLKVEITSFCMENSHSKEATDLFKRLKKFEEQN